MIQIQVEIGFVIQINFIIMYY